MSDTRDNRSAGSTCPGTYTSGQNTGRRSNDGVFDTSSEHSDNDNEEENEISDTSGRQFSGPPIGSAMGTDPYGMTAILMDIRSDVKHMNRKFDRLEKSVQSIKKDNKKLKAQNKALKEQVDEMADTLEKLDKKSTEIEQKNERLEAQSRRENLKFYGIPESAKESWEESEEKVRKYISEELDINERQIKIERAHRMGSKSKPKPIIVKFSFFKDKDEVLKTYRQKQKARRENESAQGEGGDHDTQGVQGQYQDGMVQDENSYMKDVRVTEDFVERVTRERTALFPFMKDCWKDGKEAFLRYDQLVVDGVPHIYDSETKMPVAIDK